MTTYTTCHETPLGRGTLAARDDALVGLWLEGQKYFGATLNGEIRERNDLPIFVQTRDWLGRYFSGEKPLISELNLDPAGSSFRKTVWKLLCQIPYGEVTTYGELAGMIATASHKKKMSSQAVGGAVGHNAISIIIPCHRVVGANGSLTGYAGGIAKKIQLLIHEQAYTDSFFIPGNSTAP